MKLITTKDVLKHNPCNEWTEERLKKKLGKGKTLLQILNMKSVSYADRIWCVTRFLPDKTNRKFAIWCARQCKTDVQEITDYIDTTEKYYNGQATEDELSAAYSAADWAADRATYSAAGWAAYRAAYWAECRAAHSAAERKKQIAKLKELLKESEG